MIVVTGGAGFIGSNLVRVLAASGAPEIVVVDELDHPAKVRNISASPVADLIGPARFLDLVRTDDPSLAGVTAILHQGARTSTLDDDGAAVMAANFEYSQHVFAHAQRRSVPFVYASSAAVYGSSDDFDEERSPGVALNVYAYSKQLFDQWVRRRWSGRTGQVVGLRYFNVYGPGEDHKGSMASVVTQFDDALAAGRPIRLFGDGAGARAGEHRRDFVHVDDVVGVICWMLAHPACSGILNCGTGTARSFNDVAAAVVAARGGGHIEYVEFPAALEARYQPHTEADLSRLRAAGYTAPFVPIDDGIPRYLAARSSVPGTVTTGVS